MDEQPAPTKSQVIWDTSAPPSAGKGKLRSLPIVVAFLVASLVALRACIIGVHGEEAIVQFMGDDAYYYLVLARNFVATGHWTFDGSATATGFHLLWGYILAGVQRVAPSIDARGFFIACASAATLCYGAAAYWCSKLVIGLYGVGAVLAVLVVLGSGALLYTSTIGVESPLVLAAASAAVLLAQMPVLARRQGPWLILAAALGAFGSLARSDFGLLPACLLISQMAPSIWHAVRHRERPAFCPPAILTSVFLLIGAVAGLAVVSLHCWFVSGSLLQHSAQMKAYWSKTTGHSFRNVLSLAEDVFVPYALTWKAQLLAAGALFATALVSFRLVPPRTPHRTLFAAGCLAFIGYMSVYLFDSQALQLWYTANFAIPAIIVLAPLAAWLTGRERVFVMTAMACVLTGVVVVLGFKFSLKPRWTHQLAMRDAGRHLASENPEVNVGAWNAGILSFFSGRLVINLDGLVNDDIYSYATQGSLAVYVDKRKISRIVDFTAMLNKPTLQRRGGYADGRLSGCMKAVADFSRGNPKLQWNESDLTEYDVDATCLSGSGPPSDTNH